jgi:hypothetical protein
MESQLNEEGGAAVDGAASTDTTSWWMTWQAPAHYVVDDVASTGTLCGGWRGEHRYSMWWMTWRAPVHYMVDDLASTGARYGR